MSAFAFFGLWTLNMLLMAGLLVHSVSQRSPFTALWFSLLAVFHLPSLFDWGKGYTWVNEITADFQLNEAVLIRAQFFATCVLTGYIACLYLFGVVVRRTDPIDRMNWPPGNGDKTFFAVLAGILILTQAASYQSGLAELNFTEARDFRGIIGLIFGVYPQYFLAGLAPYLIIRGQRMLYLLLLLLIGGGFLLFGGSRQPILLVLVSSITSIFMRSLAPERWLIVVAPLVPVVLWVLQLLLYVRNLPVWSDRIAFLRSPDLQAAAQASYEPNLRFAYYYFMVNVDSLKEKFFALQYFKRALLWWFPTALSGGWKPDDFEYVMFQAYVPGREGSLHATFFGTLFADCGLSIAILPWCALLALIHSLVQYVPRFLTSCQSSVIWSLGVFAGLMFARGSFYGPIVFICTALVVFLIVNGAMRFFVGRRVV